MVWSVDKRYLSLELYSAPDNNSVEKSNKTVFSLLDINSKIIFKTTNSVSGGFSEANITINGLNPDKMAYLASISTQWLATAEKNKISIDAGYEQSGHNIIFQGILTEAIPNLDSANYSITLKAQSMFFDQLNNIKSYSFQGDIKASEIANQFAKDLGFVFVNSLKNDNITVSNYQTKDKSITENIRYLASITGLDVFVENNRLYIKESGVGLDNSKVPVLTVDSSNMIGSPKITPQGVNVKIRLNPQVITGQIVEVKSVRFETINTQKFVLQSVSYTGDTKGNDWTTHLTLIREDRYGIQ